MLCCDAFICLLSSLSFLVSFCVVRLCWAVIHDGGVLIVRSSSWTIFYTRITYACMHGSIGTSSCMHGCLGRSTVPRYYISMQASYLCVSFDRHGRAGQGAPKVPIVLRWRNDAPLETPGLLIETEISRRGESKIVLTTAESTCSVLRT